MCLICFFAFVLRDKILSRLQRMLCPKSQFFFVKSRSSMSFKVLSALRSCVRNLWTWQISFYTVWKKIEIWFCIRELTAIQL